LENENETAAVELEGTRFRKGTEFFRAEVNPFWELEDIIWGRPTARTLVHSTFWSRGEFVSMVANTCKWTPDELPLLDSKPLFVPENGTRFSLLIVTGTDAVEMTI